MRLLVTIPHAFLTPDGPGLYGSESSGAAARAASLQRCVAALWSTFGPDQLMIGEDDLPANPQVRELAVVLVTSGGHHLADTLPPGLVHHHRTEANPRLLGFECHALLRSQLGRFDWYCYLEDDLELSDALFFDKLAWFEDCFGTGALLQPNRFEVSLGPVPKLYIDGTLLDPTLTAAFQDVSVQPRLQASAFGRTLRFARVNNPHAGCFFASAAQMDRLAAHPEFGHPTSAFVGPLESAATYAIMRCFAVYKPVPQNAAFLEVKHLDQRLLDRVVSYREAQGGLLKRVEPPS